MDGDGNFISYSLSHHFSDRRHKRDLNSAERQVYYKLNYKGQEFTLSLTTNDNLLSNEYVLEKHNGSLTEKQSQTSGSGACHLIGTVSDGNVQGTAAISTCEGLVRNIWFNLSVLLHIMQFISGVNSLTVLAIVPMLSLAVKGIIHPRIKMYSPSGQSRCRWVCFFIGTDLFLQTLSFSHHKTLTDGLEWCGLLVDHCDVFISCLDSYSDGTHSLQRIHCWASDVMLHFNKSVLIKKQTIYILDGLMVRTFSFWGELFSQWQYLHYINIYGSIKFTLFTFLMHVPDIILNQNDSSVHIKENNIFLWKKSSIG